MRHRVETAPTTRQQLPPRRRTPENASQPVTQHPFDTSHLASLYCDSSIGGLALLFASSQVPFGLEVIALEGVSVVRDGQSLLSDIDWHVDRHECWVVLGPNGAGKTTLLQVASTYLGPTRGVVRLLGETRGEIDVRTLRERVGYVGSGPAGMIRDRPPGDRYRRHRQARIVCRHAVARL